MADENKTGDQEPFNMDTMGEDMKKDQPEGNKSLGEKVKGNIGNIIFVVVLVGLVIGAYVYSQKSQQKPAEETKQATQEGQQKEEKSKKEEKSEEQREEETVAVEEEQEGEPAKEDQEDSTGETKATEATEAEEETVSVSGDVYTVKAESGDGITHLARKALKDYLKQNPNKNLTKEQKIYIEDYMQNATGTEMLEIGETRTFSKSLVEEAITESESLTPAQLDNLKQYSNQVSGL